MDKSQADIYKHVMEADYLYQLAGQHVEGKLTNDEIEVLLYNLLFGGKNELHNKDMMIKAYFSG